MTSGHWEASLIRYCTHVYMIARQFRLKIEYVYLTQCKKQKCIIVFPPKPLTLLKTTHTDTDTDISAHSLSFLFLPSNFDLWILSDRHWLACFFFTIFCFYRIVLISGRRSFYSVFSVLPYRDCSQAGYVSYSMLNLVTSSSLCSLFPFVFSSLFFCGCILPLTGAYIAKGWFWWMHFYH